MKNHVDIGVIATFGLPNGCTQSSFYSGKFKNNKSLDLNTNAINIFPYTSLYVFKREIVNNEPCLIFGKYSFAKEKKSNRGGTFIGAFISFYNWYPDFSFVCSLLNEFHSTLIENNNNVLDSVLQVNHSKDLQVKPPNNFEKLENNFFPLNGTDFFSNNINNNETIVVYSEDKAEDNLVSFFKNSLENFQNTEIIYYTNYREIAEFVKNKSLFKILTLTGFKNEIEKIKLIKAEKIKKEQEQKELEQKELEKKLEAEKQIKEALEKEEEKKRKEEEERKKLFTKKNVQSNNENQHKLIDDFNKLLWHYDELKFKYNNILSNVKQNEVKINSIDFPAEKKDQIAKPNNTNRKLIFYIVIPFFTLILTLSNIYYIYAVNNKNIQINDLKQTNNELESVKDTDESNSKFSLTSNEIDEIFPNGMLGMKLTEIKTKITTYYKPEIVGSLYTKNPSSFTIENKDTICNRKIKFK